MEKSNKNQEGVSILENIVIFLFYMISSFVAMGVIPAILENSIDNKPNIWIKLIESILFIVIELLFIKFYKDYSNLHLSFKKTKSYKIYIWLLVIIIGYIWFYDNSMGIFLDSIIKIDLIYDILKDKKGIFLIHLCIYFSVLAPIFEEIVFRGLILNGLLKRYNYLKAILVSSIFFALIHSDIKQVINAFFLGLIFGIVYYRTDSLLPCIFLHFANNFIYVLSLYGYELKIESSNFSLVELIMGAVILIISYFMYRKFIKTERDKN